MSEGSRWSCAPSLGGTCSISYDLGATRDLSELRLGTTVRHALPFFVRVGTCTFYLELMAWACGLLASFRITAALSANNLPEPESPLSIKRFCDVSRYMYLCTYTAGRKAWVSYRRSTPVGKAITCSGTKMSRSGGFWGTTVPALTPVRPPAENQRCTRVRAG